MTLDWLSGFINADGYFSHGLKKKKTEVRQVIKVDLQLE
jgi:hypothetical protein